MANVESTAIQQPHQSPELATALLKLEFLKILEKEWRAISFRCAGLEEQVAEDFQNFMKPFYLTLNSASMFMHGSDDELSDLFGTTRFDAALWENKQVVEDIGGWTGKSPEDLDEGEKYDLGRLIGYGFVAGMMFSGMTGVTLPLMEPVSERWPMIEETKVLYTDEDGIEVLEGDHVDTAENRAFKKLRLLMDSKFLDYQSGNDFIGIQSALECSPEFRAFSKEHNIDRHTMAELLVLGMLYAEEGGPDGG